MTNPYLIQGPALISFSGGRTSAYMLHKILEAHGGTLPDDVHVCFANTGKEREETLRFVHECATRWNVRVRWLEWVPHSLKWPFDQRFQEVGLNSADRTGAPFAGLIAKKGYLPNAVTRFCTSELKVKVMTHFMRSLGYDKWTNIVGLRADEPRRAAKVYGHLNEEGEPLPDLFGVVAKSKKKRRNRERWTTELPLFLARAVRRNVINFWFGADEINLRKLPSELPQGFDLGLEDHEGNCDKCFLKAFAKLCRIERERPGTGKWWSDQEVAIGGRFVTEYSYAQLAQTVQDQGPGFDWAAVDTTEREHDAECGAWCG